MSTIPSLLRGFALAIVLAVLPRTARAHEIHTTLTVITMDADGVTVTVRSFADDFSASVARHAGRAAPGDSSIRVDEVTQYVRRHFTMVDAAGRAITLEPCGVRRQAELYFACFRARVPGSSSGVRIRNRMLTETHADQVNIVQVDLPGARRTLLFTRTSAPAALTT